MACIVMDKHGNQVSRHADICQGLEAMRSAKPGSRLVSDKGAVLATRVPAWGGGRDKKAGGRDKKSKPETETEA